MKLTDNLFPSISAPVPDAASDKKLACWAFFLIVLELFRIVGFISIDINHIILLGMMLVPVIMSLSSSNTSVNSLYIIYFLYLVINIGITQPPAIFQSWSRLGLFIGLLMCMSPIIENQYIRFFRFYCFKYLMILIVPLAIFSFVGYFLGINYIKSAFTHEITMAGAFAGLFKTSMVLGPISAISTCYAVWVFLKTKKILWLFIAIMCMAGTLLSASRAAVFGGVIGCCVTIYYGNKTRAKSIKQLLSVIILACVTFPIWESTTSGISQKNMANKSMGEYGSRTEKFEARLSEFESSPIFGVGFASIDINGKDVYDPRSGVVEPGSSWLGVLSMTGVVGLVFMLLIYFKAFRSAVNSDSNYGSLLAGLLSYSAFHELFEGYLLAAGSVLCLIAWLIIGVATDLKYYRK